MFLPAHAVQTLPYLLCGFLFLLLLLALPWLGRRRPPLLYAWIWIAPFMAGTLLLVFTPIYPFSISTRYLMIPAVGLTWILGYWLSHLPARLRNAMVAVLVFISALAVISNGKKYGNETAFWKSALASCPNDSFFLNKYAGQLKQSGDFLGSETLLRRALTSKMKNSTAVSITLQLAEIAFEKARYGESLAWLEKIRSLPLTFPQSNRRRFQLLKIHQARGDMAGAETVLQETVLAAPGEQNKKMRVELYLAFAAWEKAGQAARELSDPAGGGWLALVEKERLAFQSLPRGGQSRYFLQRGSFALAWKLCPKNELSGVAGQLQIARLALLAGNEAEGQRHIEDLARQGKNDFRILNSLGNLFFELHRADQALPHYQHSLQLNPGQPALRERIRLIGQFEQKTILR
jgi:tetratricopeptide (TPR) repeat protein